MQFFWDGVQQAWQLIIHDDPYLRELTITTLKLAFVSTAVALLIGLPIGLALGLGRFRGRGTAMAVSNAGLGLPPVLVGLFLSLLMFPLAPLGRFHLLYTMKAVYIGQTVLALPIIIALTAASVRSLPPGLLDQARAFGASTPRVCALALREARIGIFAATIAAVGSSLSEVGAVVLLGGNIQGLDQTLASAALQQVDAARFGEAIAIGIILLGLIMIITAALTVAQHWGGRLPRIRPSS
jgi:tungstate transport system permease protein